MTLPIDAVALAVSAGGAALRLGLLAATALIMAATLTAPLWRPRPVIVVAVRPRPSKRSSTER